MSLVIFFALNSLEAFLVAYFLFNQGSVSSQALGTNLSGARLVFVLLMVLIGSFFLILTISSARKSEKWKGIIFGIINQKKVVSLLVVACFILLITFLFLLASPPSVFGDFQQLFLRAEPILAWLTVVIAQVLVWIISCYIIVFVIKRADFAFSFVDMDIPTILFLALVLVKLVLVTSSAYGPSVDDELEYYDIVFYLNQGAFFQVQNAFHYPFLYAVSLLPAMAFSQHTFTAIKFLNVLLSSSVVFPVYFLARLFLDNKKAAAMTFLCCLVPFHLVFPRRIQSENLYYPLFFWSVLFIFTEPNDEHQSTNWDILSGMTIGALYLTRYITLAALPAFFLGWWFKKKSKTNKSRITLRQILYQLILLVIVTFLTFSPWLFLGLSHNVPIKELLGFGIAANVGDGSHLTFQNLVIWFILYACYYVLIASPFLPLIIEMTFSCFRKKAGPLISRWMVFVGLLVASYGAAVVRHSWRAYYNADLISKIMGRYLIFFSPLFLLTAFITFSEIYPKHRQPFIEILARSLLSFVFVLFACLVLIANVVFSTDKLLLKSIGSIDGYYVKLLGCSYLLIIGVLYLIFAIAQIQNWRRTWLAGTILTAIFYTVGLPTYLNELVRGQVYSHGGQLIAEAIFSETGHEGMNNPINLYLPNSIPSRQKNEIAMSVAVRGFKALSPYTYDVGNIRGLDGFVLLPIDKLITTQGILVKELEINADKFALLRIQ